MRVMVGRLDMRASRVSRMSTSRKFIKDFIKSKPVYREL